MNSRKKFEIEQGEAIRSGGSATELITLGINKNLSASMTQRINWEIFAGTVVIVMNTPLSID